MSLPFFPVWLIVISAVVSSPPVARPLMRLLLLFISVAVLILLKSQKSLRRFARNSGNRRRYSSVTLSTDHLRPDPEKFVAAFCQGIANDGLTSQVDSSMQKIQYLREILSQYQMRTAPGYADLPPAALLSNPGLVDCEPFPDPAEFMTVFLAGAEQAHMATKLQVPLHIIQYLCKMVEEYQTTFEQSCKSPFNPEQKSGIDSRPTLRHERKTVGHRPRSESP